MEISGNSQRNFGVNGKQPVCLHYSVSQEHFSEIAASITVPLKCKLPLLVLFLARHVSFLSRITEAFSLEYITHVLLARSQRAYQRQCYYTHM